MNFHKQAMPLVLTTATLLGAVQAQAQEAWYQDTVGNYDAGENWFNFNVPGGDVAVIISDGEATKNGNLERAANTTVDGNGALIINGRFLNARNGGPATFTVADSGSLTMDGDYFIVATNENQTGVLNQTAGTINAHVNRGFFTTDGTNTTGNGSVNLSGGVFNVEMRSSGGDLHNVQIGRAGNDFFNVDGGTANFYATGADRRFYVTHDSQVNVSGGSLAVTDFAHVVVGYGTNVGNGADVDGNAQFNLANGVVNVSTGDFVVGDGQDGVVNVAGGELNIGGNLVLGGNVETGNGAGMGSFFQTGGQVVLTGGQLILSEDGQGIYTLTEGLLKLDTINYGGGEGGSFVFEGGQIELAGDQQGLISESWFTATNGVQASYNALADVTTVTVPEPAGLLVLAGASVLGLRRRRQA